MARLDSVLDEILSQHDYPLIIEGLVTEMVLLTALIGQTMKLRWKLSLQVRGNGPVRLIATDYYGPIVDGESAKIRAYASYDADKVDLSAKGFSQIGKGHFAILIDQGPDTKPYQGITPISGGSLSACAETYFAQSEQLPTRFSLAFGHSQESDGSSGRRAGGIMLQHMPTSGEHVAMEEGTSSDGLLRASDILDGDDNENWSRVNLLLDTADELEMVGPLLDPERLIRLLFTKKTLVFSKYRR
jgi:molecular chaperone Hsp33